jgi:hypothetical protein
MKSFKMSIFMTQPRLRQLPSPQQEPDPIYSITDGLSSLYTKREYRRNFKRFLNCYKMSPEDLLNQARKNPRLIESTIINYIRHLAEEEKLAHKTIHVHCYARKLVFICNTV